MEKPYVKEARIDIKMEESEEESVTLVPHVQGFLSPPTESSSRDFVLKHPCDQCEYVALTAGDLKQRKNMGACKKFVGEIKERKKHIRTCLLCGKAPTTKNGHEYFSRGKYTCTNIDLTKKYMEEEEPMENEECDPLRIDQVMKSAHLDDPDLINKSNVALSPKPMVKIAPTPGYFVQHTPTKPVGAFKRPPAGEKKKITIRKCGQPSTTKYEYTSRGKYTCTKIGLKEKSNEQEDPLRMEEHVEQEDPLKIDQVIKSAHARERKKRTCWTCGQPATTKYGHKFTSRGKYTCTNIGLKEKEAPLIKEEYVEQDDPLKIDHVIKSAHCELNPDLTYKTNVALSSKPMVNIVPTPGVPLQHTQTKHEGSFKSPDVRERKNGWP